VQLGGLKEKIGQKDEAASSYGSALQYIPDFEAALAPLRAMKTGPADYELARVAFHAGKKEEARRLIERAAKESPKLAWVQVALGEFRAMDGDEAGARSAFQAALALEPANEEAKAGLDSLAGDGAAATGGEG
jgi:tetratricopeptide (TPR) repeat protein